MEQTGIEGQIGFCLISVILSHISFIGKWMTEVAWNPETKPWIVVHCFREKEIFVRYLLFWLKWWTKLLCGALDLITMQHQSIINEGLDNQQAGTWCLWEQNRWVILAVSSQVHSKDSHDSLTFFKDLSQWFGWRKHFFFFTVSKEISKKTWRDK